MLTSSDFDGKQTNRGYVSVNITWGHFPNNPYDHSRQVHIRIDQPLSISIFDEHERKFHEISDEKSSIDYELIYSQLLINSLLQMKIFVKDKNEFVQYCFNYYRQNEEYLRIIEEFHRGYSPLKSLWWLTRNSFISRIIDKALRRKNFHLLFLMRFFLQDIYREIISTKSLKPIRVYRSQLIFKNDFQILENSIGKLLSFNSFFLTNLNRKQSLSFLKESTITDEFNQILFEIDADPKLNGIKSFSNITSQSYFIGEQQILFMPGTIFRLINIKQENKKFFVIQMKLATSFEEEFQLNNDLEQTDLFSFGHLLIEMKLFHQADIYFNHLLNDLPFKHQQIPLCFDALANIHLEIGQYDSSLKWLKKSLEIKTKTFGRNHSTIASIHNHIASVYLKQNDSTHAVESFQMALTIFQQKLDPANPHITECLNNMAMIYRNDNQYEQALQCYQRAFDIQEKSLADDHPDLAMTYTNMAFAYAHLHRYELALEHYNKALHIYEKILPTEHCLVSMIYENMGNVFYDQKQFEQGLLYYEKAATMYRNLLPSTHPDVLQIAMVIRRIESKIRYL